MKMYKVFNLISLLFIIITGIYIGVEYSALPERIPIHFGLNGEPDSWGNKGVMWILMLVFGFLYVLLSFIHKVKEVQQNNAKQNIEMNRLMSNTILLILSLMFFYIANEMIEVGKGLKDKSGNEIFIFIALILLASVVFSRHIVKKKKEQKDLENALKQNK